MSVTFQLASPLDLEGIQLPRRVITHNHCLWEYRGAECGYGGDPPRDSDLDGLPVANQFDEVLTSGELYDTFDSDEKEYLNALNDYLEKKKSRDEAEAEMNLALASRENACQEGNTSSEYFYDFDSEDQNEPLEASHATFTLIKEDDNDDKLVTIVFSGSTVTGEQYTFDPRKKGRAGGEIADSSISVEVFTYNGVYEVDYENEGDLVTFAMTPRNVEAARIDQAYVFDNSVFSIVPKDDITDNETSMGFDAPFGLRQVEVVTESNPGDCAAASGTYDAQETAFNTAQSQFDAALSTLTSTWNGLSVEQQDDLRDRFDVCGKRLTSCQLRFGNANLPYGGFPGANLTRG